MLGFLIAVGVLGSAVIGFAASEATEDTASDSDVMSLRDNILMGICPIDDPLTTEASHEGMDDTDAAEAFVTKPAFCEPVNEPVQSEMADSPVLEERQRTESIIEPVNEIEPTLTLKGLANTEEEHGEKDEDETVLLLSQAIPSTSQMKNFWS